MSIWKAIFDSAPAKYQWGAIDGEGAIMLFAHRPKIDADTDEEVILWFDPKSTRETLPLYRGSLTFISNEVAKSSLVHRKDIK